ncbi:hypothetical protein SteCoe_22085 [Stentor coeruleus]|uniref:Sucrose phosphatase-like domain-containing protein n=1 Tax=Stentor coeruleus TaxID=5963 RepID=A0A1R2BMV9_9CILI|nr:hypothetical protein SteCoe_22085 [Stentor coeruleus]
MSEIYLYLRKLENFSIIVNGSQELGYEIYNKRWGMFHMDEDDFQFRTVSNSEILTNSYHLPSKGRYALYKGELIEIVSEKKKVLLVSDLDKTLWSPLDETNEAYDVFIKYWISHFGFNDSILVYNTGRNLKEYIEASKNLFEPDAIVLVLGNYAYVFNELGEPIIQEDYQVVLRDFIDPDWDSQFFSSLILSKFEINPDFLRFIDPYNICFIIPDEVLFQKLDEIKEFVKNPNKERYEGRLLNAKCIVSRQYCINEHFLEILPISAGKHLGLIYCQRKFGFTNDNTMIAGDSLNDIDVLKHPVYGVLVGNSEPLVKEWYAKKPRANKYLSTLTMAYAVKEGLEKFVEDSFI